MVLPAASFACSVRVIDPPDATVALETLTTEPAAEIPPAVTVRVGSVVVTAVPLTVAPIVVALPATAPVNAAVQGPVPLSAGDGSAPVLVPPDDGTPPSAAPLVRLLPKASFAWSVRVA